jgi:hypothetical protein
MSVESPCIFLQSGGETAERARRYTAAQMALRGGIVAVGDLAVTENGTPNMSVNVAGGQVFIPGTEGTYQGHYCVENRGTLNVALAAADATNPRKDLLVAKVQDAAYSGATNAASIVAVTGTPAASPAEPAAPANSWVLAMVDVPANDTAITNSQITDRRTSQTGQKGRAAALGGFVVCTSGNRPSHSEGLAIYETDTDRAYVSDGTNWRQLNSGNDAQQDTVATNQSTTSGTYTDLATVGPAVTVHLEPNQKCEVGIFARSSGDVGTTGPRMSYAVSGAETITAATRETAGDYFENDTTSGVAGSKASIFTATTGGSYTFTAKYRRVNVTTASFAERRIIAKPL